MFCGQSRPALPFPIFKRIDDSHRLNNVRCLYYGCSTALDWPNGQRRKHLFDIIRTFEKKVVPLHEN